jgi:hypothetical protein
VPERGLLPPSVATSVVENCPEREVAPNWLTVTLPPVLVAKLLPPVVHETDAFGPPSALLGEG